MASRWVFLRLQHIPDLDDPSDVYLSRLRIIETPWFGVYLHAIRRPDGGREALHDHPWGFVTLILRGGYDELHARSRSEAYDFARVARRWPETCRLGVEQSWGPGSVHRMRLSECHMIRRLWRTPTWTLVFVGPRRREWGYVTTEGWVHHEDLHHARNPAFPARVVVS